MDGRVGGRGQPSTCGFGPSPQPNSFLLFWALASFSWARGADNWLPLWVLRGPECCCPLFHAACPRASQPLSVPGLPDSMLVTSVPAAGYADGPWPLGETPGFTCDLADEMCNLAQHKGAQGRSPVLMVMMECVECVWRSEVLRAEGQVLRWEQDSRFKPSLTLSVTLGQSPAFSGPDSAGPEEGTGPHCVHYPGRPCRALGARLHSRWARGQGGAPRSEQTLSNSPSPVTFLYTLCWGIPCEGTGQSLSAIQKKGMAFWGSPSGL